MSEITLNSPVTVAPAIAAVTSNKITVLEVRENFGWNYDPSQPGGFFGPGRPQTVEATVLLSVDPQVQRTITVWEGEAYLAVRGTWTDADLAARITEILAG